MTALRTLPEADVAIVGLGPVGMVLAGLLGRRGVRVVAFERATDVFPLPRAAHIDHTGLRTIQELGCVDELLPHMIPNPGIDFVTADGQLLSRIPGDQGSQSGYPASLYFHQPGFDRELRKTVQAQPTVSVILGTEARELADDGEGVVVSAAQGTRDLVVKASYVVACDGASSPMRDLAGIQLEDLDFHERWLVVDLVLEQDIPTLPDHAVVYCDPSRPVVLIPMPLDRFRCELMLLPEDDSSIAEREEDVAALLAPWLPPGAARVERQAVYTFHGLVARPWRRGRVLLAGDAAHQMPPFLGQGMNSGIRDAANLAWKLDLVVAGSAGPDLLDTYEQERRPHVQSIVDTSVRIGRVVCTLDRAEAAKRDRDALTGSRSLVADIAFDLPELEVGPLVRDGGGGIFPQPVDSASGTRFDDVVGGRFLLLVRDGMPQTQDEAWWMDRLGALVTRPSELPEFRELLNAALDRLKADVVAVRPDRYVLAAGTDVQRLTIALRKFIREPSDSPRG